MKSLGTSNANTFGKRQVQEWAKPENKPKCKTPSKALSPFGNNQGKKLKQSAKPKAKPYGNLRQNLTRTLRKNKSETMCKTKGETVCKTKLKSKVKPKDRAKCKTKEKTRKTTLTKCKTKSETLRKRQI